MSVLLLAAGFIKSDPKAWSSRVFAIMAVFVVFYIVIGMGASYNDVQFRLDLDKLQLILSTGASAIPGLFMIYCFLTFQEQQKFPKVLAYLFAAQITVDVGLILFNMGVIEINASLYPWIDISLDSLQMLFVAYALYWTLKGWRADLVEDRRALRWLIIAYFGGLIFLVLFVENFLVGFGLVAYSTVRAFLAYAIAVTTLSMLVAAMRFDYVSLSSVIRKVTEIGEEAEPEESKNFDEQDFDTLFAEAKLYQEAGLTIAVLSLKLNLPEYRLRAFIHKQMGFRNFNAMLHKYRIDDACQTLADKNKLGQSVLTTALAVGYQSITPFNNAFKQIKGMTPSEYRRKNTQV